MCHGIAHEACERVITSVLLHSKGIRLGPRPERCNLPQTISTQACILRTTKNADSKFLSSSPIRLSSQKVFPCPPLSYLAFTFARWQQNAHWPCTNRHWRPSETDKGQPSLRGVGASRPTTQNTEPTRAFRVRLGNEGIRDLDSRSKPAPAFHHFQDLAQLYRPNKSLVRGLSTEEISVPKMLLADGFLLSKKMKRLPQSDGGRERD